MTTAQAVQKDAETRMQGALEVLGREFAGVRTGRANAALLEHVRVDFYDTPTPLNQVASISVPDARTLMIQPWDQSAMKKIEQAIQKSDLGLTPANDGKAIRLTIPSLNEERRKQLAKSVGKLAEEARVAIRNVRREAKEKVKALLKDKKISEDDERRSDRPPEAHRSVHPEGRRAPEEEGAGDPRSFDRRLDRPGCRRRRGRRGGAARGPASAAAAPARRGDHGRERTVGRTPRLASRGRAPRRRRGGARERSATAGRLEHTRYLTLYAFSIRDWTRPAAAR